MLIHFNDLFTENADGTVSPLTKVQINGKMISEGDSVDIDQKISGLSLAELNGKFLEGERKPDGQIDIKSYVRGL